VVHLGEVELAKPRSQNSFVRTKSVAQCELCGKEFMQTRWWQVFCSKVCRKNSDMTAKFELRKLRLKVQSLEEEVRLLKDNSVVHPGDSSGRFTYDGEDQSKW
jgi:hypothetical protein